MYQKFPINNSNEDSSIIAGDPNNGFKLALAKEFPWMVYIEAD